ncbi:hypothetical protein B0T20DRAFT_392657 [Sordaria brevicollis]|uniref:Uncharacterized protein n=1 Tax=Sordaria brevicollis TaxID=83679 RepID=A0AAE0PE57_SORBR|nr:hypothetical protein B0T20DRAFT_392657 [Sordaria brevicollis]
MDELRLGSGDHPVFQVKIGKECRSRLHCKVVSSGSYSQVHLRRNPSDIASLPPHHSRGRDGLYTADQVAKARERSSSDSHDQAEVRLAITDPGAHPINTSTLRPYHGVVFDIRPQVRPHPSHRPPVERSKQSKTAFQFGIWDATYSNSPPANCLIRASSAPVAGRRYRDKELGFPSEHPRYSLVQRRLRDVVSYAVSSNCR